MALDFGAIEIGLRGFSDINRAISGQRLICGLLRAKLGQ